METITIIIIWLSLITLFGLIVSICSAAFAYWFLTIRNPIFTEIIADYKLSNKEKLK